MKAYNQSLIFLKKNDKTKEELENFFGKENFYQSYELVEDINKSMPSNNFIKGKSREIDSETKEKIVDNLSKFNSLFKPSISEYTERSLLFIPRKNAKDASKYKIINLSELSKPLYYNSSKKGWICSVQNRKVLKSKRYV